jgi:hypothetical protein
MESNYGCFSNEQKLNMVINIRLTRYLISFDYEHLSCRLIGNCSNLPNEFNFGLSAAIWQKENY